MTQSNTEPSAVLDIVLGCPRRWHYSPLSQAQDPLRSVVLVQSMSTDIQMEEPKVDVHLEQEEPATAAPAAADHDPAPAPTDAVEGTNGIVAGDETVVDEVSRLVYVGFSGK